MSQSTSLSRSMAHRTRLVAFLTLSAAALAACGGGSAPAENVAASAAPESSASAAGESLKGKKIAFLNVSSANTFLAASRDEMKKVAEAAGLEIVEFDGQFKAGEQSKQVQDVIAAGDYAGLVIATLDGAGIIPDLEKAKAAGIEVGILNQVVGTKLDTAEPQFDGPAVSVLAPPVRSGEGMGEITLKACEGLSPCRVVYFYGVKGSPLDVALKQGFDTVTKANPDVTIVEEAEGKYLGPDVALKATQDLLQVTPDFDVVLGPDQAMQGVEIALRDAGKLDKVKIIGLGGSSVALKAIKAGTWFGDLVLPPRTEGRLVMEGMVTKLRTGEDTGGIESITELPDSGRATAENIDTFTAEWDG